MASGRRRTVTIDLIVDDTDKRKLDGIGDTAERSSGRISGSFRGIAAAAAGAFAVDKLTDFAGELANVALQAEAVTRRSSTVFGDNRDDIVQWADSFNEAMGVSKSEAEGFAAAMGDLLVPLGFTREEAAQLAPELVEIGTALGEASGQGAVAGIEAVSAAIVGEREQLKQMGVVLSESDLSAEGLAGTFRGLTGDTEKQTDALNTMQLITELGADSIELFNNRAGTMSDTLNQARARVEDAKLALSQQLVPALAAGLEGLVGFADSAQIAWEALTFDTDARVFAEQMKGINDALFDGNDRAVAFANAVVNVATESDLTADELDRLRAQAGLTDERFADAEVALREWATTGAGAGTEAAKDLLEALGPLGEGLRKRGEDADDAADGLDAMADAATAVGDSARLAGPKIDELNQFIEDTKQAQEDAEQAFEDLRDDIEDTASGFDGAVDEMDLSLADFKSNLDESIRQQESFYANIVALAEAGYDDLAAEILERGPEARGLAAEAAAGIADGTTAELEKMIEKSKRIADETAGAVTDALEDERPAATGAAAELRDAVLAEFESEGLKGAVGAAFGVLGDEARAAFELAFGALNIVAIVDRAVTGTNVTVTDVEQAIDEGVYDNVRFR